MLAQHNNQARAASNNYPRKITLKARAGYSECMIFLKQGVGCALDSIHAETGTPENNTAVLASSLMLLTFQKVNQAKSLKH